MESISEYLFTNSCSQAVLVVVNALGAAFCGRLQFLNKEASNAPFKVDVRFLSQGAMQHIQLVASGNTICVMITILRGAWWPPHAGKKPHVDIFTD